MRSILSKTLKLTLVCSPVLLALGCASHLSQQQCANMNWHQSGYLDGSHGNNQRDLSKDAQDCSKYGIAVNDRGYEKGYRSGVRQYCQPGTAYNLGVRGQNFNNICPADLASGFTKSWQRGLRLYCVPTTGYNLGRSGGEMPSFCSADQVGAFSNAYQDGRRIFERTSQLKGEVDSSNQQIGSLNSQIEEKQRAIKRANHRINSNDTSTEQKNNLKEQIRGYRHDIQEMEDRISETQHEQRHYQRQLDRVQGE
ncbi:hypothetical protein BH10PSE19_BH10PSE19_07770 [soil metagenome]